MHPTPTKLVAAGLLGLALLNPPTAAAQGPLDKATESRTYESPDEQFLELMLDYVHHWAIHNDEEECFHQFLEIMLAMADMHNEGSTQTSSSTQPSDSTMANLRLVMRWEIECEEMSLFLDR